MSFSPSKEIVWDFYLKIKRERSPDPQIYVRLLFFFFSSKLPIRLSLMQWLLPLAVVLWVSYSSIYPRCNGAASLPLGIVAGCYSGLRVFFCCCCYSGLRVSLQQLLWLAVVAATADWGSNKDNGEFSFFNGCCCWLLLLPQLTEGFLYLFFPSSWLGFWSLWWVMATLVSFFFFFFFYLFHLL